MRQHYNVMNKNIITVKNVSKNLGGKSILSEISLSIKQGSLVALIGPNGAGKSTLVKIILGLDTSHKGSVHIHPGETIEYIPQQTNDDKFGLPISVYEYLLVGISSHLKKVTIEKTHLTEALSHVGIDSSVLQQSFSDLSGGERQRVAIARALLSKPTMLVLDEPLAAVDYSSREELYVLIRHLQQDHNMTVLLVSHDVQSIIPISDEVICLNETIHAGCHPLAFSSRETTHNPKHNHSVHHHC